MALKTIVVLICEVHHVMLWGDLCSKEGKAVQALCSRVLNHYLCSLCWCDIQGPHGLYDPRKAELVDCRLPVCSHVQSGSSYSCNAGGVNQCDYDVEYADGSSTMGVLMQDFITLMLINGTRTQRKAVLGYCLLIFFFHDSVSFMTDFICAFLHCLISFWETRKGTFRTGVLFDLSLLLYLAQKIWDHVTSFLWSCMVQSGLLPSCSMSGCLMGNVIHWQSRGKEWTYSWHVSADVDMISKGH
jgi:hypothetical protein